MAKRGPNVKKFVINCVPSTGVETDWGYEDAVQAGVIRTSRPSSSVDLRASWWKVRDQGRTGACVGFAAASGVLHWHFAEAGWLNTTNRERPSPRFIWMANKETDQITSYPTTFIEPAGTQTELALGVARKYGCVLEEDLPMTGGLASLSTAAFYTKAAKLRIASYHNLGRHLKIWRYWIANQGPIAEYLPDTVRGGHAGSLVGFTRDHFIVRNNWGEGWGDGGFAYALNKYAGDAFTDTYGAVL